MRRRVAAVIRKEFIQIIRDPRSLAVAVLLPVVMLLLYGYGINLDVKHIRTAVMDMDNTRQSRDLLSAFSQSGYFDFIHRADTYRDVERVMDAGDVSICIVVPKRFSYDLSHNGGKVQIIADGSDAGTASIAMGYASGVVRAYSGKVSFGESFRRGMTASSPSVDLKPRYWYNPELSSTNFVVPGLIAVILMLLSALLTSMTIVRERERGTIEQLVVSPIRPSELVTGKLVPYIAIAFFDIVLVTLGGRYIFHVPFAGSHLLMIVSAFLFLIAALGLGLLISCIAKTQLAAMTIAVLATMLPTILLSGFVFPISGMPAAIRGLTYLIPARYFLIIVRGILLKGVGLSVLWPHMLLLLFVGAALVGLSIRGFRKVL